MAISTPIRSTFSRFWHVLPSRVDRRVIAAAWTSLVVQILIVGTGGAVRLTGSGLGCPTWPRCTPGSFVATPEQGIHGVIEFGNRLLTFVLVIVAVAAFTLVLRLRRTRPDLFRLTLLLGLGIPAQAVLGGLTVLTGLNPWLVGAHFVVSILLVVLASVFVFRATHGRGGAPLGVPSAIATLTSVIAALVGVTILVGIVTTGSGPHAGDAKTPRNGLDPEILQHVHSYPAYTLFVFTLLLVYLATSRRLTAIRGVSIGLLAVEVVQIGVGVIQSRLGLPELLVGIHMVLACVLAAVMTTTVLATRRVESAGDPRRQGEPAEAVARQ